MFFYVMTGYTLKFLEEHGCPEFILTERHIKCTYKIFTGYSTIGTSGNEFIKLIIKFYCELRYNGYFSTKNHVQNEKRVIMEAIYSALKDIMLTTALDVEPHLWMLPIIQAVNEHIAVYTKLPFIRVDMDQERDNEFKKARAKDTKQVKHTQVIDGVAVNGFLNKEKRSDVRAALKAYLDKYVNNIEITIEGSEEKEEEKQPSSVIDIDEMD